MILKRIKSFFAQDFFPRVDEWEHQSRLLSTVLYTIIVLGILGSLAVLGSGGGGLDTVLFAGVAVLTAIICLLLVRTGHIRLASSIILIVLWGLFTLIVGLAGGVRVATFGFFGVLSLIGGFLLGYRAIFISVLAAVLTGLGLYLAEQVGWLPPIVIDSLTAWIANSAFFIFQGLLLYMGLRALSVVLQRWRSELAERKRIEAALRASEERFRCVVEFVPIGMYLFDLDDQDQFILRMANPASVLVLQGDQAAKPGCSAETLFSCFGDSSLLSEFYTVARGGAPFRAERLVMDGAQVVLAVEAHLFSTGPKSVAAAFVDITQRKQSEMEREKLIRELEAKNTELERFTYTVSHDLKSPLITIRGFLGFISRDAQNGNLERLNSDLNRVIEATHKMQRLLDDLLELSRIGRIINSPQAVPFNWVVRDALELVAGQIAARGAKITLDPDLPVVFGDRARLVEVVQNLLDNALKFMDNQNNPHIEVGTQPAEEPDMAQFYVRDNGQGIEPRFHETVFGLFNKLDANSDGTGVGLALVRRIIEVHGGKIWIESFGEGKGAAFCFTLPVSGKHDVI